MALDDVLRRVAACRICRDSSSGKPLPHEPRPVLQAGRGARILIAGQAPGIRVHESGRPFTDPSGDRLRQWLGVTADEFYDPRKFAILPMGFCFPGLDRNGSDLAPRRECAPQWRRPILAELPEIDLVICLGAYAMQWHMGGLYEGSVDPAVRNWRPALELSPRVIPLPHPSWRNSAWLNRNPWFNETVLPILRAEVRSRLGSHQLAASAPTV